VPKVNGKSFPYTRKGKAKAKAFAKKTGKKMTEKPPGAKSDNDADDRMRGMRRSMGGY
jgi:hypothetical protein